MPSLSAVKASNQAWRPVFRPVVVVAGGTNGIGAGIATAFARYGPKDSPNAPYIIIIGRSRQGADTVIEEMKKANSAGKYEFVQGDLSLMGGARTVASEVLKRTDKINFLCMSPGILSVKVRENTNEGIDRKMALHFYSRFLLANLLIPKLEVAAAEGEDARTLSVLSAGLGGAIDLDDMDLQKNPSLKKKADFAISYNDLMVEELAIRYPNLSFTHAYPGFVSTNITSNLPFYLRLPAELLRPLSVSQDDCADYMIYNLLRPENRTGAHFFNNKGDNAKKNMYFGNADMRNQVWKHASKVTGLAAS